jgi:hypothetical protein
MINLHYKKQYWRNLSKNDDFIKIDNKSSLLLSFPICLSINNTQNLQ